MFNISKSAATPKVIASIKNLPKTQSRWVRKAFYYIGKDLVKDSQKLIMAKPKHGKLYKLKDKNGITRLHRASAPGEAPANFNNFLFKAIDFNVVGSDRIQFGAVQQFSNRQGNKKGVTYGKYLELGTRKMAQRPYLEVVIKSNKRNIVKHFETQLKRGLTQGTK